MPHDRRQHNSTDAAFRAKALADSWRHEGGVHGEWWQRDRPDQGGRYKIRLKLRGETHEDYRRRLQRIRSAETAA